MPIELVRDEGHEGPERLPSPKWVVQSVAAEVLGLSREAMAKRFSRHRFPASARRIDGSTVWVDLQALWDHIGRLPS